MFTARLPVKSGYEEVSVGDNHTYRRIETGRIFYHEIKRMPRGTDDNKISIKNSMIVLIKEYCMDNIYKGFEDDCKEKGKMLHYSLTDVHQRDIENIMLVIGDKEEKGDSIYWRDSSRVMYEKYTVDEFTQFYKHVKLYKTINKLYSDGLEEWILRCYEADDVDTMLECTWGSKLPDDIREEVDRQVMMIEDITAEELKEFKEKRKIEI